MIAADTSEESRASDENEGELVWEEDTVEQNLWYRRLRSDFSNYKDGKLIVDEAITVPHSVVENSFSVATDAFVETATKPTSLSSAKRMRNRKLS
jgi:hypothetical protein